MRSAKEVYLYDSKGDYVKTYRTISEFAKENGVRDNVFSPTQNKSVHYKLNSGFASLSRIGKVSARQVLGIKATKIVKTTKSYTFNMEIKDNKGNIIAKANAVLDPKIFNLK